MAQTEENKSGRAGLFPSPPRQRYLFYGTDSVTAEMESKDS